jgi:hypothetical protein
LTISSNLQKGVTTGALKRFGEHLIENDEVEVCCLLATQSFDNWYDGSLPYLDEAARSDLTPDEEIDSFVRRYLLGKPITEIARLQPTADGIWEIKLAHTRLFGWFPEPDVLVLTDGASIKSVKSGTPGYDHYFDHVKQERERLGLGYVAGDQIKTRPCRALSGC